MKRFIIVSLVAALCGCRSGLTVILTDSSAVTAGSYQVGETPIPAVSYNVGPRFLMRSQEGMSNLVLRLTAYATITNETSALGIYDSSEGKELKIKVEMKAADGGIAK